MFTHLQELFPTVFSDQKKLLLFVAVVFALFLACPARFIESKMMPQDKVEATGLAGVNLAVGGLLLGVMLYAIHKGGVKSFVRNHIHVFSFLACAFTVIFSSMIISNLHNEQSTEDVPAEIVWTMSIVNLVAVAYWVMYFVLTHENMFYRDYQSFRSHVPSWSRVHNY